jgi:hypothetical protein
MAGAMDGIAVAIPAATKPATTAWYPPEAYAAKVKQKEVVSRGQARCSTLLLILRLAP